MFLIFSSFFQSIHIKQKTSAYILINFKYSLPIRQAYFYIIKPLSIASLSLPAFTILEGANLQIQNEVKTCHIITKNI